VTFLLWSANVVAKHELWSFWHTTKYRYGTCAGWVAAWIAVALGLEIGVGGRPAMV
jgi:ABC-type thiamine transport system substrate-binding protein